MSGKRGFLLFIGVILIAVLIGPLIVPLPPLEDIKPVEELAYARSQFLEIDGISIHYEKLGNGEPNLVLLHGFGASTYSWHEVIEPLADRYAVLAYDRPAFGLTERVIPESTSEFNPYRFEYQTELLIKLMDENQMDKAVLIGNSAGGTFAIDAALAYPDRITSLVLVSPAVYGGGGAPGWIRPFLGTPQFDRLGPVFVRSIRDRGLDLLEMAWHDPALITQQDYDNYQKPLHVENWDAALWEFTKGNGNTDLVPRLEELKMPILIITGDDDRIVPTADSVRLADEMPNAELAVLENCGHVPQEECPEKFLEIVNQFLAK